MSPLAQLRPSAALSVRVPFLAFTTAGQYYQLPLAQIVLIQTQNRGRTGCLIRTADGRTYRASRGMGHLQNQLPGFWRVSTSHLVNPKYVQGSVGSVKHQGELRLRTGQRIAVYDAWKARVYTLLRLQEAAQQQTKQLGFVAANFVMRCSR